MNYKEEIKKSMDIITQEETLHIGYGLITSGRGGGSLKGISNDKIVETPVAENLMLGLAIGLSLEGYTPVVYYERFDFIMNAMDALVNHLDKIREISNGEFSPKVLIRCVVGGKKSPFFTGTTHTQDFTDALKLLVKIPVYKLGSVDSIQDTFINCYKSNESSIIVEEKDRYAESI
jgi:pyruvate/2-oxoglutarate/acetoin dehydrogenase E1 component